MSGEHNQGSLARVQTRIADLTEQLDWTLETARDFVIAGRADLAQLILDHQRTHLLTFAEAVARDTASPRRSRRRAVAVAAGTAAVAATLAVGVMAWPSGGHRDALRIATVRLKAAEQISDPAARMKEIAGALDASREVPAHLVVQSGLGRALADEASSTSDALLADPKASADVLRLADAVTREAKARAVVPVTQPTPNPQATGERSGEVSPNS